MNVEYCALMMTNMQHPHVTCLLQYKLGTLICINPQDSTVHSPYEVVLN